MFVGNAWDPGEGRETPWIDVARQLAGDEGVAVLGTSAKEIPPGTTAIAKLVEVAGGSVLILCDEVSELHQPLSRRGCGKVPRIHPEPDRCDDGDGTVGRGHQPAAQPSGDVRLRPPVAGEDQQGRAPGGERPDCQ